ITLHTVARVIVQGKFPPDTVMHVQLHNRSGTALSHSVDLSTDNPGEVVRDATPRLNFPAERVTLKFTSDRSGDSEAPSFLNIYNIHFELAYVPDVFIGQQHLRKYFDSEGFDAGDTPFIKLHPDTGSASLQLTKSIFPRRTFAYLVLSLVIGVAIFLLVGNSAWASIPAFYDLSLGNKISTTREFDTINGLRGLAAIFVILSHTAPGFYGLKLGVGLLFVFSGFLLSKPFVKDPDRIFKRQNIQRYLVKRLKRILPVYYLYIFMIYVVTFQFDTALRHFLFIESAGHLWPMTQIFTFYMLLPLVLLITSLAFKLHRLLPIILLAFAIYIWIGYFMDWRPYYNGRFSNPFFLYAFLLGVLGSYLQYDGHNAWVQIRDFICRHSQGFAIVAGLLTVLTVAWSAPVAPPALIKPYMAQFYVKCTLSLLIILLALNIKDTWYNAIVSNPLFRSVGVVGFSFYILHGLGMQIVLNFQQQFLGIAEPLDRSWMFFLLAFMVTYVMALISYSYVERPFFGYKEQPAAGQA
ncbi:MAG: acyltransferase, partial [Arenicella sp.]|nr:acyltransferase [Arenicella sp.]